MLTVAAQVLYWCGCSSITLEVSPDEARRDANDREDK